MYVVDVKVECLIILNEDAMSAAMPLCDTSSAMLTPLYCYHLSSSLHELVDRQVALNPDNPALLLPKATNSHIVSLTGSRPTFPVPC